MKNKSNSIVGTIIFMLIVFVNTGFSQELTSNILLGQSLAIESKYLNETREVFINIPEGYLNSQDNYPVLYVLDGERNFFIASAITNFLSQNQQIPNIIVVGIPNVNRNRDFTPVNSDRMPNSGGADNFVNFLSKELMPTIDEKYRTHDYQILFGHSLTGMFGVYTLLTNSELFDAFLTASPYVMYYDNYVLDKATNLIGKNSLDNKYIFISVGDEPNYFDPLTKLTGMFTNRNSGIKWEYNKYNSDTHDSIPIKTIADGLPYIFSDFPITQEVAMGGLDALKAVLNNRQNKYGMTTYLNEVVINTIGYQLLQANEIDKSIEIFKYNIELFSNSSNVYDSLGDAYDAKGSKKKALKYYKKAVQLGELENNPNLSIYKNNVERLEKVK